MDKYRRYDLGVNVVVMLSKLFGFVYAMRNLCYFGINKINGDGREGIFTVDSVRDTYIELNDNTRP